MSAPHVPAVTSQAIRFRSASMKGQIFHVHVRAIVEKPFLVTRQLGISALLMSPFGMISTPPRASFGYVQAL